MKKWSLIGLAVILFVAAVAWKIIDAKNCTNDGGIVIAPLTGHQECVTR